MLPARYDDDEVYAESRFGARITVLIFKKGDSSI